MQRNKIIQTALAFTKFIYWFLIVLLVVFSILILHSTISPETYSNFQIINYDSTLSFNFKYCSDCPRIADGVYLSDMSLGMKIWVLFHFSAFCILLILITNRVIKVEESIKDYATFYKHNVQHFRQIAKYAFFIFILGTFNFIDEGPNGIGLKVALPIGWIAFALGSLILSEIFKEGNQLQADKDAII